MRSPESRLDIPAQPTRVSVAPVPRPDYVEDRRKHYILHEFVAPPRSVEGDCNDRAGYDLLTQRERLGISYSYNCRVKGKRVSLHSMV